MTEASNTAGAAVQQAATPTQHAATAQPSIIIVEVLGFGGGETPENGDADRDRRTPDQRSYNPNSRLQVIGLGQLSAEQKQQLADDEQRNLPGQ